MKTLITIRLDRRILAYFRRSATRQNLRYQSLINETLLDYIKERSRQRRSKDSFPVS